MAMNKDMEKKLADPWWRLNHLYHIKTKEGEKVLFKLNAAQRDMYKNMWYLNIILKARQLGFTTFIQIFMLDRCLFNSNQSAGVVAHVREDAEEFFSDKIKFAYDNLPEDLKAAIPATNDTARSLKFANGSKIVVGTSLRSGSYQYTHISEFGKMCAKFPEKAEEVIAGTLNTIAPGQICFIESTAEGPFGEFYDRCNIAQMLTIKVNNGDAHFTKMDWRFAFYGWFWDPGYVLHEKVEIEDKMRLYFQHLADEHNITLSDPQKAWYVKKALEQGEKMKQEFPSTPQEAFERVRELAIFGKQLRKAQYERRITDLPIVRGIPVNTFWDLGRDDYTAIWFHQFVENWHHFIYYFQDRLQDLTYYADQLFEIKRELNIIYGSHYLPHDVEVTDLSAKNSESRKEILETAGVSPIIVVPKSRNLNEDIEKTRQLFSRCKFDEEGCEVGLRGLHMYEWKYDDKLKIIRQIVVKNVGRHPADALRQCAQGYRGPLLGFAAQQAQRGLAPGGGRRYAQRRGKRGTLTNPTLDHVV